MRRLVLLVLLASCGGGAETPDDDADAAAPRPPRPDALAIGCLELPRFEAEPVRPSLAVSNAGEVLWETGVRTSGLDGITLARNGSVYASTGNAIHRVLADGTYVEQVSHHIRKESIGLPAISDFGEVLGAGGNIFVAFGADGGVLDGGRLGSPEGERLGAQRGEAGMSLRGAVGYASSSDGSVYAFNLDPGSNVAPSFTSPRNQESHYGDALRFGIGNVLAINTVDGSDFLEADTGRALGRLFASDGLLVQPWLPTGGGLILAAPQKLTRNSLVAFDDCGAEVWRWESPSGHPTPRLVSFDDTIIARTRVGQPFWRDSVVVLDRSGQLVAGPRVDYDPLLVGADGTLYASVCTNTAPGQVVALDANLDELWAVDAGCPVNATLSDDGVLYVGGSTGIVAIQTTSPGLAPTLWPSLHHDNRNTNWVLP